MGRLTEQQKDSLRFQKSFAGLCEYGRYPDYFDYVAHGDEELFIRVLMEYHQVEPKIAIAFPRSEKMKSFYPAIRQWFKYHDLKWQDRSRNGLKYMIAFVDKDPILLERLLRNAGLAIFGKDELKLDASAAIMVFFRIAQYKHPKLYIFNVLTAMLSIFALMVYEVFHLNRLSGFSIEHADRVEICLAVLFFIGFGALYTLRIRPKISYPRQDPKWHIQPMRALMAVSLILIFFTSF